MRPMEISLDHCVIHVSERARSDAFYRDVLGAELVAPGRRRRCTASAPSSSTSTAPACAAPARAASGPAGRTAISASPGTEPIEAALEHLARTVSTVELGPVRRPGARGDGTSVYFRDPDGSLLELISYR